MFVVLSSSIRLQKETYFLVLRMSIHVTPWQPVLLQLATFCRSIC